MGRLKQWPPALLRRWLLQAASGLGCLAVGSIVFLAVGDSVLLSLSVLLALLTSLRCASFYRLIDKGAYEAVEGVCIRIKHAPLCKQRSMSLLTADGTEQTIQAHKRTPVQVGHCYRVYLQRAPAYQTDTLPVQFLALEDLGDMSSQNEPDSQ